MKTQRIENFTDAQVGDIILLIEMSGKIKGMDKITDIDYTTGQYCYKNFQNKNYEGNLKYYMNQCFAFKTDESIYNYTDEALQSAFLDFDEVFENMYGYKLGTFIRSQFFKNTRKDFGNRVAVIDFANKYKNELHIIRWEGDEEVVKTKEEVDACKSIIQKELNKLEVFDTGLF